MVYFSQHFFSDRKKKTLDYSLWFLQNLEETMTHCVHTYIHCTELSQHLCIVRPSEKMATQKHGPGESSQPNKQSSQFTLSPPPLPSPPLPLPSTSPHDVLALNQASFSCRSQARTSRWLSSCLCLSSASFSMSTELRSCSFFFLLLVCAGEEVMATAHVILRTEGNCYKMKYM